MALFICFGRTNEQHSQIRTALHNISAPQWDLAVNWTHDSTSVFHISEQYSIAISWNHCILRGDLLDSKTKDYSVTSMARFSANSQVGETFDADRRLGVKTNNRATNFCIWPTISFNVMVWFLYATALKIITRMCHFTSLCNMTMQSDGKN